MSKNLKKFLALALALAMVFALAACGEPAPAASETPDESCLLYTSPSPRDA